MKKEENSMKKEIITEDFLDPMPLEDIKRVVNSFHKGSWHSIMLLDGAPITLEDGSVLYVTETFPCSFNINYYKMAHVQFKNLVEAAHTPEQVAKTREVYGQLKHPEFVAKTALRLLEQKEKLVADGKPIAAGTTLPKKDKKTRDSECPAIVYCDNGSTTLTFYDTCRNTIKSVKGGFVFEKVGVKIRYFVKGVSGRIHEIKDLGDEKLKKTLEKARTTARAAEDKKSSAPSPVYSPRIQKVLNIW